MENVCREQLRQQTLQRKRGMRRTSLGFRYQPLRWKPLPGARWAAHSGQGQKGGRKREGRTDSTDSRGQCMSQRQSKDPADRKARESETSLSGNCPERPQADSCEGYLINKLAATVG